MHFGKPVFLARRTCLPEIGGDAAWYFDDFDPATMRRIVEAGLQQGGDPARVRFVEAHAAQFDWDRCADQYLSLYHRLLNLPQG
jgi:glycosyltransferase involved in cell wall biosynthesis